ncbi:actin nucleation-promoting factor WASL-like [Artibeus jamaicensis]|uniref:actin nucleation-promoting factor WASL-like n=1 Tax=Artibeus jamaicensis TaxID=9417 RepID=UPI00235AC778|nr:actin nucleation-promoting factor WASL-like [Artibeus jamaicensis]
MEFQTARGATQKEAPSLWQPGPPLRLSYPHPCGPAAGPPFLGSPGFRPELPESSAGPPRRLPRSPGSPTEPAQVTTDRRFQLATPVGSALSHLSSFPEAALPAAALSSGLPARDSGLLVLVDRVGLGGGWVW